MDEIKVYCTKLKSDYSDSEFLSHLNSLPNKLHEKILKVKHGTTRYSKLFGLLLLKYGLKLEGFNDEILAKLEYTAKGKPFIPETIEFNISHADNMVVCALSKFPIGIDIAKIREVNIDNFRIYFTDEEYEDIINSADKNRLFYNYWTKEAFAKAVGQGLTIPFANIIFKENIRQYNNQKWYIHEFNFDNEFAANICTSQMNPNIVIKEISFNRS